MHWTPVAPAVCSIVSITNKGSACHVKACGLQHRFDSRCRRLSLRSKAKMVLLLVMEARWDVLLPGALQASMQTDPSGGLRQ